MLPFRTYNQPMRLSEPSLGVKMVKSVRATPGHNLVSFNIGRGAVAVNCPPGAEVRIDGRLAGTTPLSGSIPVSEGDHVIQVSKGGQKWQQGFSVGDGETMSFEVQIGGSDD